MGKKSRRAFLRYKKRRPVSRNDDKPGDPPVEATDQECPSTSSSQILPATSLPVTDSNSDMTEIATSLKELVIGMEPDDHDRALRRVLDWLPLMDVVRCGQVCRQWRAVAKDPDFWKDKRVGRLSRPDPPEEINEDLAVLAFAPCLAELSIGMWGPWSIYEDPTYNPFDDYDSDDIGQCYFARSLLVHGDEFIEYGPRYVGVITNSGIKITTLKLCDKKKEETDDSDDFDFDDSEEDEENPCIGLLKAVSEHIEELDFDGIVDDPCYNVIRRMPNLRALKMSGFYEGLKENKSSDFTSSVQTMELTSTNAYDRNHMGACFDDEYDVRFRNPLILQHASTIEELTLDVVGWSLIDIILDMPRLRVLKVSNIRGDLPPRLPTPKCHIESLTFTGNGDWFGGKEREGCREALIHILSDTVSELTLRWVDTSLFDLLSAMPKLSRLHFTQLPFAFDWETFPPVSTTPFAPLEDMGFRYLEYSRGRREVSSRGTVHWDRSYSRVSFYRHEKKISDSFVLGDFKKRLSEIQAKNEPVPESSLRVLRMLARLWQFCPDLNDD